jgi:hypothetical protein
MKRLFLALLLVVGCGPNRNFTGANGSNGLNSLINITGINPGSQCLYGGTLIATGLDANGNNVLDSTEVTQSSVICNGTVSNGSAANLTPTIAITPCGPNSATYKEALLGLFGGGVFAYFVGNLSDASQSANILMPDNTYFDTDTSKCKFTLTTDSSGNRSMVWDGTTQDGHATYNPGFANYNATTKAWTVSY